MPRNYAKPQTAKPQTAKPQKGILQTLCDPLVRLACSKNAEPPQPKAAPKSKAQAAPKSKAKPPAKPQAKPPAKPPAKKSQPQAYLCNSCNRSYVREMDLMRHMIQAHVSLTSR